MDMNMAVLCTQGEPNVSAKNSYVAVRAEVAHNN